MQQTENNQVAVIENSIEVLKTGPQILVNNQIRKDKAIAAGQKILAAIEETGMDAELDEYAKNYLIKINGAAKEMKDQRSAVTQIMDGLKKMYTEVEAEIDPKKAGSVPARVQAARDDYAKQVAEAAEKKRKEAERVAAISKAKIDLAAAIDIMLNEYFNSYLLTQKQKVTSKFNSLVLDSFADDAAAFRQYQPAYKEEHFNAFTEHFFNNSSRIISSLLSHNDVKEQLTAVMNDKYSGFSDRYVSEMLAIKQDIVDKLPSKLEELREQRRLDIEKREADRAAAEAKNEEDRKAAAERQRQAEENARIAAEDQKRREQEEESRLAKEAEEAQRLAEQNIEINKQGEQTMVMFEQEAAIAEMAPAPEVRQGYEITVLHPVGFTQLFALWFEKVGKDMPVDKIGNTKLDQMKAWAEKEAHKSGTKVDSKFLKYEETFKAVNRKTK